MGRASKYKQIEFLAVSATPAAHGCLPWKIDFDALQGELFNPRRPGAAAAGASGANASEEFRRAERLGYVVIGTGIERFYLAFSVLLTVSMMMAMSSGTDHANSIPSPGMYIQQDEVGFERSSESLVAGAHVADLIPASRQGGL